MRERKVDGETIKRIGETTVLSEDKEYVVVATYKDGDGDPYIKTRGTWDECDGYADRNDSPDNPERYYVAEVVG